MMKSAPYVLMSGCVFIGMSFGSVGFAKEDMGIRIGNLTISPYVNLEANYDSNVDLDTHEYDDWYFTINPGVDVTYEGNDWGVRGNVWYAYDKYKDYEELDEPRYGFRLSEYWESPKGWRAVFGQSWMESKSSDSILDGGRGIWRERSQWDITGALSYQMSEKTGVTLSGQYSDLNYKNDGDKYGHLYGWNEWSVGLELARKLTEKSNLLLAGNYQEYSQNNTTGSKYDNDSTGYSLMAGLGSRATERITYRLLTGASWFDYGEEGTTAGWTYSVDGNWLISRKWAATIAGSSYFQPSETEQNQAMQAYTMSVGLTYRPITRLTIRGDVGYRREDDEYKRTGYKRKMTDHIYSARLRADYQFVKHASVYAGIEYSDWESDEKAHEYDRILGTVGLRLRY